MIQIPLANSYQLGLDTQLAIGNGGHSPASNAEEDEEYDYDYDYNMVSWGESCSRQELPHISIYEKSVTFRKKNSDNDIWSNFEMVPLTECWEYKW